MPTYRASILIDAAPSAVFAYVADLAAHGEWSADPLEVTPVTSEPAAVGKRYRSVARVQGRPITAELEITAYQPPHSFAFATTDLTGRYEHRFSFTPQAGGTLVERMVTAQLSLAQRLLFLIVYPLRKLPNTRAALRRLKTRLETPR